MTRQELHNRMVEIVDSVVEHYETDFYDYDVETLDNAKGNNHKHFVWIPRECGTFLLPVDNAVGMESWFDAIVENFHHELVFYDIKRNGDDWRIVPSCEKKAREAFAKERHFKIQVVDRWDNERWDEIGLFDNQLLATEKAFRFKDEYSDCSIIIKEV